MLLLIRILLFVIIFIYVYGINVPNNGKNKRQVKLDYQERTNVLFKNEMWSALEGVTNVTLFKVNFFRVVF